MNLATYCYIPAVPRLNPDAFIRNLRAYKSAYPVHLYSEVEQDGMELIPDPSGVKQSANRVSIQNIAYLHSLRMAERDKVDRFIYLELDVRVHGDNWDATIFNEASQFKDMFVAGSGAVYNRRVFNPAQTVYVNSMIAKSKAATGFDVPEFEAKLGRPIGCWFIMGAAAVYSTPIMAEIFQSYERDMAGKAVKVPAFDLFIAMRCYQLFKEKAVQKLPFLTSVFSSYSNKINTEKDRIEMAKSGRWAAVHQIKSNESCL